MMETCRVNGGNAKHGTLFKLDKRTMAQTKAISSCPLVVII